MTVPVRRFEPGASGYYCVNFLAERGYRVGVANSNWFWLTGPKGGRPKKINKHALMALVDQERVKAGLEPIVKREGQCR